MSILQANFGSDTDTDDESFQGSVGEGSEESCSDTETPSIPVDPQRTEPEVRGGRGAKLLKKRKHDEKKRQKNEQQQKARSKAEAIFAELQQEHLQAVRDYPAQVAADDLLLRFQRRAPVSRRRETPASIMRAVELGSAQVYPSHSSSDVKSGSVVAEQRQIEATDVGSSGAAESACPDVLGPSVKEISQGSSEDPPRETDADRTAEEPTQQRLNIRDLKKRCRSGAEHLQALVRGAVQGGGGELKEIVKTVRFAGQEFEIKERVGAETDAYRRSMRKKAKVGGQFEGLDRLVHALDGVTAINSVQKSRADWCQFKESAKIDDELRRGRGYLERQAFLADTKWNLHQQNVELRRKQEQQLSLLRQQQIEQKKHGV